MSKFRQLSKHERGPIHFPFQIAAESSQGGSQRWVPSDGSLSPPSLTTCPRCGGREALCKNVGGNAAPCSSPTSSATVFRLYKELGNRSSMNLQLNNRAAEEPGAPFCFFIQPPETKLCYRTSATQIHPNPEHSTPPWLSRPGYPSRPTPPQATRWQRANPRFNLNS